MTEKKLSLELQRLSDKVAADPQSRLFVQLADEYLKCGLFQEAIGVLVEGIQHHPAHVAARMMLGKIYLKTKQVKQAKEAFESVVEIYPENILAHKNLAQIYREIGQLGHAITIYKTILKIDPKDQEAKALFASLQQEIEVMEGIHSLSEPKQKTAPLPPPSYALSGGYFAKVGAAPLPQEEPPLVEQAAAEENPPVSDSLHVHAHASSGDEADISIARLEGWLTSIQEKRKDGF